MKIVFMGTPEFAVPILEMLIKEKYNIVLVVTQPDKSRGRSRKPQFSEVKEVAIKNQIEVFQPQKIGNDYQKSMDLSPNLIITAAYGQMIPNEIIDSFKSINVHGSLLPKYRGGAPIQKALLDGEKSTGITIMYMAEKMDAGDILYQAEMPIEPNDNYGILMTKLSLLGRDLLENKLPEILRNEEVPKKQQTNLVSFAYTLKRHDEIIDFNQPSKSVINQIRALSPNIGGTTFINGVSFKVYCARVSDIISLVAPRTVLESKDRLLVSTKDFSIELLEVQLQGKRKMSIKSFLNGQQVITDNDVFTINKEEEK